ncbi:MAG: hypothetical protein E6Q55_33720 [Mycolicibacterium mageritense]|nr:MAG: hypothetical protein E6Q55_33720 [Mycolicibacterium mageritense]
MDNPREGRNTMRQNIIAILSAADEPLSTAQVYAALAQCLTTSSVHRHPATHERVYRQLLSLQRNGTVQRTSKHGRHVCWSMATGQRLPVPVASNGPSDITGLQPAAQECGAGRDHPTASPARALDVSGRIAVRTSDETVTMTYGRPGIDRCRAVIGQHGYTTMLRVQLNYNALTADDIEAVERAIAEIACRMVRLAAAQRHANSPLFGVAHVIENLNRRRL